MYLIKSTPTFPPFVIFLLIFIFGGLRTFYSNENIVKLDIDMNS